MRSFLVLSAMCLSANVVLAATADEQYQSALAAYAAKDYLKAITLSESAVKINPKHWQAWQLDGNARYAMGDKSGALSVYRYSLQINPSNRQLKDFVAQLDGELGTTPQTVDDGRAAAVPEKGRSTVGLKAGVNLASRSGKDRASIGESQRARLGFVVGGFKRFDLSDMLSIQPEMLYSQKGGITERGTLTRTYKFDYLEFPVRLNFNIPVQGQVMPNIFVGPTVGVLLSAKKDLKNVSRGSLRAIDFGLVIGAGISPGALGLEVRYGMGLSPISAGKSDIKNAVISVMINY